MLHQLLCPRRLPHILQQHQRMFNAQWSLHPQLTRTSVSLPLPWRTAPSDTHRRYQCLRPSHRHRLSLQGIANDLLREWVVTGHSSACLAFAGSSLPNLKFNSRSLVVPPFMRSPSSTLPLQLRGGQRQLATCQWLGLQLLRPLARRDETHLRVDGNLACHSLGLHLDHLPQVTDLKVSTGLLEFLLRAEALQNRQ